MLSFFFSTLNMKARTNTTPHKFILLTKIHLIQKGANRKLRISSFQKEQCYPQRQKGFSVRAPLCCRDNTIQPWPPAPTSQLTTARMFTAVIPFQFTSLQRRRKQSTFDSHSRTSDLLALTPVAQKDIWKAFRHP